MKMKLVKVLGVTLAVSCMLPMTAFAADAAKEAEAEVEVIEAEEALEDIATPEEAEAELEIIEDEDLAAEDEMAEAMVEEQSMEDQLADYIKNIITPTIIALGDEEIEMMKEQDEISAMFATAWESNKADLGELVEIGTPAVVSKDEEFTITQPVDFDVYDAEFVYTVSGKDYTFTSFTINVDYPFSVLMKQAGMNTIMGIGTVFVMLIFLSGVIALMGMICKSISEAGNKKTADAPKTASIPAPAPVVVEEETDDEEIIAVIAAAIAAAEGTSPDGFVVRSVRKVNRRKW